MTEDDYLIEIDKAEVGLEKANSALAVLDDAIFVLERDLNKFSLLEQHYLQILHETQKDELVVLADYIAAKKQLDNCKKIIQNVLVKKEDLLGKKAELQTTISIFVKSIHSLKEKSAKAESKKVIYNDFRRNTKPNKKR